MIYNRILIFMMSSDGWIEMGSNQQLTALCHVLLIPVGRLPGPVATDGGRSLWGGGGEIAHLLWVQRIRGRHRWLNAGRSWRALTGGWGTSPRHPGSVHHSHSHTATGQTHGQSDPSHFLNKSMPAYSSKYTTVY